MPLSYREVTPVQILRVYQVSYYGDYLVPQEYICRRLIQLGVYLDRPRVSELIVSQALLLQTNPCRIVDPGDDGA